MSASNASGPDVLAAVERELTRTDLRLRFHDLALEEQFSAARQEWSRPYNRAMIPILIAIFDLYLLTEFRASPEIIVISVIMRTVLTLAVGLLILLDWRGVLGRLTGPAVIVSAVLPTLFGAIEAMFTHSATAIPNFEAIPLIQLVVVIWRMSFRQAVIAGVSSCMIYCAAVMLASFVPPAIAPSLILSASALRF